MIVGAFWTSRPACRRLFIGGRDIVLTRHNDRIRPFAIVGRAKFETWCLYQKPLSDAAK
jgi:hypothetical protein